MKTKLISACTNTDDNGQQIGRGKKRDSFKKNFHIQSVIFRIEFFLNS